MTARYPYVHVQVPSDEAELVSTELFELGASGIEERDATTLVRAEAGPGVLLVASFDDDAVAHAACEALADRFRAHVEHVEGDAWRDAWKAYFKPTRVGTRLVVKPSWESYEAQPDDVVLTLDPAGAFGTGTHETTRLVLGELEALVTPGMRVLDVGTGSGILAVACALLGAASVRALDVDDESMNACRENAEVNGVADRIAASRDPIESVGERHPLVLANIETRILVPMASTLMARVERGGTLVLSGILIPELPTIREAYAALRVVAEKQQGEWAALVLRRDE